MSQTTQIAIDRSHDAAKTVLPTEVARGIYVENPPSAEALKLMHLLIATAGGRMADPVRHELRLANIKAVKGMRNHSRTTLRKLFGELAGAVMIFDDTEAQCEIIGGFLDRAKLDYRHELSDDLLVAWWFGGAFREMAEKSNHWAIIDRQTVFALSSKYSILLFQHIASLMNLSHITSKSFTVPELRAVLGVETGKLKQFGHLNSRALQPAIAEINQLARVTLTATLRKIGRTVASVEISWEPKPDLMPTKHELDSAKTGRKARRDGTEEVVVPAFPASGGIRYTEPWQSIAMTHGNGKDIGLIGKDFRAWAKGKFALDSKGIEKKFEAFCKGAKL